MGFSALSTSLVAAYALTRATFGGAAVGESNTSYAVCPPRPSTFMGVQKTELRTTIISYHIIAADIIADNGANVCSNTRSDEKDTVTNRPLLEDGL